MPLNSVRDPILVMEKPLLRFTIDVLVSLYLIGKPIKQSHTTESDHNYSGAELNNKTSQNRYRRSAKSQVEDNVNLTVETAVFVDETLYTLMRRTFPSNTEQQIVTYVLTIMNAVQLLFKQPSLGRNVEISVVLMDILKQQPRVCLQKEKLIICITFSNYCHYNYSFILLFITTLVKILNVFHSKLEKKTNSIF